MLENSCVTRLLRNPAWNLALFLLGLCCCVQATSPPGDVVGKVTVGYQGWFACTGDGAPIGTWWHYSGGTTPPTPNTLSNAIHAWPDMRQFQTGYQTAFPNFGNGQPARLFSSVDDQVVQTHFRWMAQNGIDTAALQRFDPFGAEGPTRDIMATKVMNAAQTNHVKFYIMYDCSGWNTNTFDSDIKNDWTNEMCATLHLTNSPMYAMQNGKPVVCIWGFGFNDGNHNFPTNVCVDVITFFKNQGCYVIGGVPTWWREGNSDSYTNFLTAYASFNMISPWMVGRIGNTNDVNNYYNNPQTGDQAFCNANGIDFQPCVLPGDSGQRLHGDFMWYQFAKMTQLGAQGIYISMFDEFNEGNQIACTAEDASMVPAGYTNLYFTLDQDGTHCSSDYYLRLTGDGDKMFKGQIGLTFTRPTQPVLSTNIPPTPTNLLAVVSNAQVRLTWATSYEATSYNIKRALASGGPYSLVSTNIGLLSYLDTNLAGGTTYYYVVSAVDASGESTNSFETSVTLPGGFVQRGATVPWTTYEAESMTISGGTVLGPGYSQNNVQSEASGRKCVQLNGAGQYVQFTAQSAANAIVVRYSVPDTSGGGGANYTLSLYRNGTFVEELPMTSTYSWLYGSYPFVNTPSSGSPRNFFDEVRASGLTINQGDTIRLQVGSSDTASFYDIDLVDLEEIAAPLTQPGNSLSIITYGADNTGVTDSTTPLENCISAANSQGKSVWMPSGNYLISSQINLPSNITIQGAGMWYATLVGNPSLYSTPADRITLNGTGSNIHLSDFAITGKLTYRNDSEPNDGLGGAYGTGSTISRLWVEHTKTGAWIVNSQGLLINGCRFRDTIADGCNLSVGMQGTIVTNCTTRGTGDDCFAVWPASYLSESYTPGQNLITQCTGEASWLANGGAIYGGDNNLIQNCLFQDMTYDCGVLLSTTFPVATDGIFSGSTTVQNCDLNRDGGSSGLQVCLDLNNISGLNLNNLNITNSIASGVTIIQTGGGVSLSGSLMSGVSIPNYNLGGGGNGLWAESGTTGNLTVSNCTVQGVLATSLSVPGIVDSSSGFTFNFVTANIGVTVGTSPTGLAFSVDGNNYTSPQNFNWVPGSNHTIATTGTQSGGTGTQYVWNSWNDSGAISHVVAPTSSTTYTASFTTQYFLTMNAGTGGSVSPASQWTNSGSGVTISATPTGGYNFTNWTGSGSGSYSGNNNPASITMNGPITETAAFTPNSVSPVQTLSFTQQPSNTLQGVVITPEVQVKALGTNGQAVAGASISLSLGSGTGTLSGTLTHNTDTNGLAHFNDLSINLAGPKILTATVAVGSAPPTNSNPFSVIGSVAALAFTTQPGSAAVGIPFGQQPVLKTVDQYGTPTTTGLPASLPGQVTLTNGTGTLLGTTTFDIGTNVGNGVVTFTNLAITASGTNDQLIASASGAPGSPVAGAVLWFDANATNTMTLNSTNGVTAWTNGGFLGGALGTPAGGVPFFKPTLVVNSMNGRPVVRFTTASTGTYTDAGQGLENTFAGLDGSTNIHVFIVARQPSNPPGNWSGFCGFGNSGAAAGKSNSSLGEDTGDTTGGFRFFRNDSNTSPSPSASGQFSMPFLVSNNLGSSWQNARPANGNAFVNEFLFDGSVNAGLDDWLDQGGNTWSNYQASTVNYGNFNITDFGLGGQLGLGSGSVLDAMDWPMNIDIAEVLVYTNKLAGSNRGQVMSYLENKWLGSGGGSSVSNALSQPFAVTGTSTVTATVTTSPTGLSFTVDGTNYTTQQTFNWTPGSNHTIATTNTQSGGTGTQYVWSAWSDAGALSHNVAPTNNTTYIASFTTQYFLTMNAGTGGSVSPGSLWTNSGAVVSISATPSGGYYFNNWTGSGSGSYSGNSNPASVTMNAPVTETGNFTAITKIISLSGNLAFGNVIVGNSANLTLTISNLGNTTLTVSGISYPGGFSGSYSGTVAAGGSTNVTVTFIPTLATNYSGNLTVTSDATSGGNTLAVSGTGLAVSKIIALGGNLAFGNVLVGGSSNLTLTISNLGNSTLTVSNISYPSGFSGSYSGTVAAGTSTNVTVTFMPTTATDYSGSLTVSSDETSGTNTLAVSGTGIPITEIIALGGNLAFGNVLVGGSSNLTLTISNLGNSTLTVSNISYPAGFSGGYSGTIAAGASTNVTVTFLPTAATNYSGDLTVVSDETSGTNTLPVSGTGVAVTEIISLGGNLAFGNVLVGGSSNLTMTISNLGNSPLVVTNISYPAGFSGSYSGTIPAGASTNITVTFMPTGATNYSGNLTVISDETSGTNTLAVSGTGVAVTEIISLGGNLAFGNVTVGGSNNLTMTISNLGNSALVVTNISYPAGFSGSYSGTITAGGSTNVTVTFLPTGATNYSGNLTVTSDATSGVNTLAASGTGVAPTNSLPVTGAVLWLDAADPTTLSTNGTKVVAWKNKGSGGAGSTGTNLWLTQYTTSLQPWLTNQLNGHPVLTFSKNGNGYSAGCTYLGNTNHLWYTNSTSQMTFFVVARQWENSSFGWQGPVSFSASGQKDGAGTAGVVVLTDGSHSAPYPLGIQRNHPGTPMQADVAVPSVNTGFVMAFVDNAGTASLSLTNGGGLHETNLANIVNGISPYVYAITGVTVGGRLEPDPSTVDNGWDGDVAEVVVYNTALSAANQAAVENYLVNKWLVAGGGMAERLQSVVKPWAPPQQNILDVTVNADGLITLTYATTPGYRYHVEANTSLTGDAWETVSGSDTDATDSVVIFTDPNPVSGDQRYYRTVSP